MISIVKLAGVSAVLAGLFVAALEVPSAEGRATAKVHYDRIAPEPEKPVRYADAGAPVAVPVIRASSGGASDECRSQTWPYVAQACIASDGAPARKPVRTITIERRDAPNTSTLVRVPAESR